MGDFTPSSYPQHFDTMNEISRPARTLCHYSQQLLPQEPLSMSVYQPYSVYSNDGFQGSQEVYQPFQTPPIAPTSSPFADDQTAVGETAMPQSANPPSSLPPSAFINESQSSAYFTASPPWTSAGMSTPLYFPHDQPVPQQMPELGYESASPSSEAAAYSRITLSESPLPKCEASDPYITDHRPVGAGDADNNDPCYADLLRQCLLGAPNYTMSLRDLYGWVAEHSPKARDPTSTGWKNSVRHNLSMNQGFEKVVENGKSPNQGTKNRSFWRLTEEAAVNGVQSTTRYRKCDGKRKPQRSNRHGSPDDKRVRSGAKGGQATRRLASHRAAAANARSTILQSNGYRGYREEPYPTRLQSGPPPSTCPQHAPSVQIPTYSHYLTNMVDIPDPIPCAPKGPYKVDPDLQGYYMVGGMDYFQQPLGWSQPLVPIKSERGWLGDVRTIA